LQTNRDYKFVIWLLMNMLMFFMTGSLGVEKRKEGRRQAGERA